MRISDWSSDVCSSDLLMRFKTANGIAFRNNPSSRLARRDQQYPGGAVRFDAVRKGGDLFDDMLRGVRCGRYGYLAGRCQAQSMDRSEESRVGKECVSRGRSRGAT